MDLNEFEKKLNNNSYSKEDIRALLNYTKYLNKIIGMKEVVNTDVIPINYKTSFYSLKDGKSFIRSIAGKDDILRAILDYLEEYEIKLEKEAVRTNPVLFLVEYVGSGYDMTLKKGRTYPVLREVD